MKSQSDKKNFFVRILNCFLMVILLFGCVASPESTESSTPIPTKSKTRITATNPPKTPKNSTPNPNTSGGSLGLAETSETSQSLTPALTQKIPCSEIVTVSENNTPPKKVFSLACANTVLPENVLKEVNFGGTGGGEGKAVCISPDSVYPILQYHTKNPEWLEPIFIFSCGYGSDGDVKISIKTPDDKVLTETAVANDDAPGFLEYEFQPKIESNTGWYLFTFMGDYGDLTVNIYVNMPEGSRKYFIEDLSAYYLYGFIPNEQVRFLWYSGLFPKYQLKGWADYQVDENGRLLIEVSSNQGYYVAVGAESGLVGNGYPIVITR